ncbi:MAG: lysine--tRNA ligase [Candidatus Nanoarchaeia archaeon]
MSTEDMLIKQRLEKLELFREQGINPYPHFYKKKDTTSALKERYSYLEKEAKAEGTFSIAGRILTLRKMGKASFGNIQDQTGTMQFYIREDEVGNELYSLFDKLDLGDIIGIKGNIFRTKTGEITIRINKLQLLSKSLRPLPEKWHGLTNTEARYRQRYIDLIVNPGVKELFVKRTKAIQTIRQFLDKKGFLEVETPLLQPTYGGASAKPFKTHLNALNMEVFLSISPELYLKRLIVGGFERVYTICKNFRNEDIDTTHNPEFTMLEFYYAYENYKTLMNMTEQLIPKLVHIIAGTDHVVLGGETINFKPPFKKIKFRDFILEQTGIDIDKTKGFESLKQAILEKNIPHVNVSEATHYGALMDELYKRVCRPKLIQPTFLTHYPVEMIALAKRNEKDPTKINSFQLLVNGAELVKAYDELNDPLDQKSRLEEQQALLTKGDREAMPFDQDFITALEVGMPPTAGYGLGVDRLIMLLTASESIKEVILFPFMKQEEQQP